VVSILKDEGGGSIHLGFQLSREFCGVGNGLGVSYYAANGLREVPLNMYGVL